MVNWLSNYVIENKPKSQSSPKPGSPNMDKSKSKNKNKNPSSFFPNNETQAKSPQNGIAKESYLPPNSQELLFKKVDEIDFNCFEYYTNSDKNGLVYLMYHLFEKASLFDKLHIEPSYFINFITKIQKGYVFLNN